MPFSQGRFDRLPVIWCSGICCLAYSALGNGKRGTCLFRRDTCDSGTGYQCRIRCGFEEGSGRKGWAGGIDEWFSGQGDCTVRCCGHYRGADSGYVCRCGRIAFQQNEYGQSRLFIACDVRTGRIGCGDPDDGATSCQSVVSASIADTGQGEAGRVTQGGNDSAGFDCCESVQEGYLSEASLW